MTIFYCATVYSHKIVTVCLSGADLLCAYYQERITKSM